MRELWRALKLRCPNCGEGKLLATWFHVRTHCMHCKLIFNRGEQDYFIGAYTINLIVAELLVVVAFVVAMFLSWPEVPWNLIMWSLVPLALLGPLITFPYARAVWLALDLRFRPPEPSDFTP